MEHCLDVCRERQNYCQHLLNSRRITGHQKGHRSPAGNAPTLRLVLFAAPYCPPRPITLPSPDPMGLLFVTCGGQRQSRRRSGEIVMRHGREVICPRGSGVCSVDIRSEHRLNPNRVLLFLNFLLNLLLSDFLEYACIGLLGTSPGSHQYEATSSLGQSSQAACVQVRSNQ